MRGNLQCTCSACGLDKGDRDRNQGWFEVAPRGQANEKRYFCPACSVGLLMAIDQALEPTPDPTVMIVDRRHMRTALELTTNHEPSEYAKQALANHLLANGVSL